jgi:uncharacterized membrane protein
LTAGDASFATAPAVRRAAIGFCPQPESVEKISMAVTDIMLPSEPAGALPKVRTITTDDLRDALRKGLDDFWAMPTHILFLGLIYPVIGILIGRAAFGYDVVPLLYPLAAGFALLGPVAAIGLYELSRRREAGMDTSWRHVFDVLYSPSLPGIAAVGLLLMVIFGIWIEVAQSLYVSAFGYGEPASWTAFAHDMLGTRQGLWLILAGNAVGFLFALLALMISAVSFPLLLDRHVGPITAIFTSFRAVAANRVTMALWGLIVAAGLIVGFATFFIGLAIIVPVLGHATWHLYRKVIAPDNSPHALYNPVRKGWRFGADFPANLFSSYPADKTKE